jgi:hypothetical protein
MRTTSYEEDAQGVFVSHRFHRFAQMGLERCPGCDWVNHKDSKNTKRIYPGRGSPSRLLRDLRPRWIAFFGPQIPTDVADASFLLYYSKLRITNYELREGCPGRVNWRGHSHLRSATAGEERAKAMKEKLKRKTLSVDRFI